MITVISLTYFLKMLDVVEVYKLEKTDDEMNKNVRTAMR